MFSTSTPDFSRFLLPPAVRKAMVDQGRRTLAFQSELASWQMGRIQAAEEQTMAMWKLSLDQTRKAIDGALAMQDEALSALSPKDESAAETKDESKAA